MKYLLDTTSCIDHLRRGLASLVTTRLLQTPAADVRLCSIVRAELMVGAIKGNDPRGVAVVHGFVARFPSLTFDDIAADCYGQIRAHLEKIGQPIGPNDTLIAAIAIANQLTLVSGNLREFSRVPGLQCEDWSQP